MFFIIISWVYAAILVANVGIVRKIGFWKSLTISLFFSPLVGLLVVGINREM